MNEEEVQKLIDEALEAHKSGKNLWDRDPRSAEMKAAIQASKDKRSRLKAQAEEEGDKSKLSYEARMFNPTLENGRGRLQIFDVIDDYWGCGPTGLREALDYLGSDVDIDVEFNSPGGYVFDGRAMAGIFRRAGAGERQINMQNIGFIASAATTIFLASDYRSLDDGSSTMIHRCWGLGLGNCNELRATADMMEKLDKGIAQDYVRISGQSEEDILTLMDNDEWMTAQEARDFGFESNGPQQKAKSEDGDRKMSMDELESFLAAHSGRI